MKILIPAQGFFPAKTYGGPPVSISNFSNLMYPEYEVFIVTSDHELNKLERLPGIKDEWNKVGRANVCYLSDDKRVESEFLSIVEVVKPDKIYINSLFDARNVIPFLKIAKKKNIPVILAPRGELCAGALKKKYKKIPYIVMLRMFGLVKNVTFQSTSDEETAAIKRYFGISNEDVFFATNIPSIPSEDYNRRVKEKGSGRFVFLARVHPKKNLLAAIQYLKYLRGNIVFEIYGPIEDENYWNECQEEIKLLGENIKVSYKGLVAHDEVHRVFSNYDAFIFPTFSENYGHVIAESLFVGTPVVISDQTPWNDVEENNSGWAIPLGNSRDFSDRLQQIIDMDSNEFAKMSSCTIEYVKKKADVSKLKKIYLEIFGEN